MAELILIENNKETKRFPLSQMVTTIGRAEEADIRITSPLVSSLHAQILRQKDKWLLQDLESTNGTFVNKQRIKSSELKNEDEIMIGKTLLKFVHVETPPTKEIDIDKIDTTLRNISKLANSTAGGHSLQEEIKTLTEELTKFKNFVKERQFEELVGSSPKMETIFRTIEQVAPTDAPILIEGETGTGKELVARAIHRRSSRAQGPFVVINCGAIPENLLESELFGYEKGAFTGAGSKKYGKFELGNKGSVFLDEIGELPLNLQVKLLRVLENYEIERIGGVSPIKIDVRIIAATNKVLKEAVEQQKFRQDLYYRIGIFKLSLPPLRERREDILLLANYFLDKYKMNKKIIGFSKEATRALQQYHWPGNIRELENRIKRAVVMARHEEIELTDLDLRGAFASRLPLLKEAKAQVEKDLLIQALLKHRGNITRAGEEIGIHRKNFIMLMRKYGIEAKK
jgi:two-component system NtrC family response regulator